MTTTLIENNMAFEANVVLNKLILSQNILLMKRKIKRFLKFNIKYVINANNYKLLTKHKNLIRLTKENLTIERLCPVIHRMNMVNCSAKEI